MSNSVTPAPQQAAPGWYPVDKHTERYWNGTAWTEESKSRTTAPLPASPTTTNGSTPWYRRTWVLAAGALLVGVMLGAASAGAADPKDSPEYQALADDLAATEGELSQRASELAATEDQLAASQEELERVAGDLPAREEAVTEAEAAVKERQAAVKSAEADVKAAERKVAARERKVGLVERRIEANTIPGEGIYQVGADMKPGLYKSTGQTDCYYAVLGDPNGNNILSNNITSGPATVSVSAGQYFEARDCADFVLQP